MTGTPPTETPPTETPPTERPPTERPPTARPRTRKPLTNDGWGFPSNCFVCEDANHDGLRIPFFHEVDDDGAQRVVADFTLAEAFSGAPALAHGGILMAVCDEAMSWSTIAVEHRFALTATNSHRFLRPVRLDRPYRVEARVDGVDDDGQLRTSATIVSASTGKVAVEASAVFVPLDGVKAAEAIGQELSGADLDYLTS